MKNTISIIEEIKKGLDYDVYIKEPTKDWKAWKRRVNSAYAEIQKYKKLKGVIEQRINKTMDKIEPKDNMLQLHLKCGTGDAENCVYGKIAKGRKWTCEYCKDYNCTSTVAIVNKMTLWLKEHELQVVSAYAEVNENWIE